MTQTFLQKCKFEYESFWTIKALTDLDKESAFLVYAKLTPLKSSSDNSLVERYKLELNLPQAQDEASARRVLHHSPVNYGDQDT